MIVAILISVASVAVGVGLGCVPVLKDHLHWNLWLVVPISGLIIGMGIGWLQAVIARLTKLPVRGLFRWVFPLVAAVSYLGVDYGIYMSTSIPLTGEDGMPSAEIQLSDLLTFRDYMSLNLGSSSISSSTSSSSSRDTRTDVRGNPLEPADSSEPIIEMGSVGTKISFFVDLLGAFLGALGAIVVAAEKFPYCRECNNYLRKEQTRLVIFQDEESVLQDIFTKLTEMMAVSYQELINYIDELTQQYTGSEGNFSIRFEQRYCSICRVGFVRGVVQGLGKNKQWHDLDELTFNYQSEPGEHDPVST